MIYRYFYILAAISAAGVVAAWLGDMTSLIGPAIILALASVAVGFRSSTGLKGYSFTVSVLACVAASMFYPNSFIRWGEFQTRELILPLIQIIMFGMGTHLSLDDFARVFRMPRSVMVGVGLKFLIMPITGFTIASVLRLEPEVAVGVILVGSCPSGVASNVMTYLAKGNVALSVTMTAVATMLAPVMTPFAMTVLAGQYVPIPFMDTMIEIVKMIIIPIAAGLIVNRLARGRDAWINKALPVVSMAAICFIITIITAHSRDKLLEVAHLVIFAAAMHNMCGYLFGYWAARAIRMPEADARTVAIEVGMQNAGMASALAMNVLKSSTAALAPAIFGPWMNISGSMLASYWMRRPPAPAKKQGEEPAEAGSRKH